MSVDVAGGLATYLSEEWGTTVTVGATTTVTAGARRHNVVFDATADGVTHRLVATIVPAGETIINPIDAEAGVRALAEQAGVTVPHVHLVRTDGELVGGPFMVSDFVDGETVPRRVLRLVDTHGIGERVATQLGETLARLHAIDPATVEVPLRTLEGEHPCAAALDAVRLAVDELPQRRPVLELGLRWLDRHLPAPPHRRSIVHSDVRNGNIIVGEDGLRVVLDWEGTLASGDPMQDAAWPALRMWRFRNDGAEIGGFAGRQPFTAGYESAGGTFDEERFRWWKVEGTLRWAVGLAAQAMAFLDGRVPSIVMAASGRRVPELEWDLLMLTRPGVIGEPGIPNIATMSLTIAAVQMAMVDDVEANIATAERLVRAAAAEGAQIVLIPELFEGPYFCKDMLPEHFARAHPVDGHPTVDHFRGVAAELDVVLPLSIYERANHATYNSVVIVDADGAVLGTYRKSHIPDGPGYTEKYYFNAGDTGFRVWRTRHAVVGVGICWDQWFPETARCMALMGAEVLCYPTAIGSEPPDPEWDSCGHWQRVMQGHAGANLTPLLASNRVGHEVGVTTEITFYGSSFIADPTGAKVAEAGRDSEAVITATFDLDAGQRDRHSWGLFRDRRPDLYGPLLTLDGTTRPT